MNGNNNRNLAIQATLLFALYEVTSATESFLRGLSNTTDDTPNCPPGAHYEEDDEESRCVVDLTKDLIIGICVGASICLCLLACAEKYEIYQYERNRQAQNPGNQPLLEQPQAVDNIINPLTNFVLEQPPTVNNIFVADAIEIQTHMEGELEQAKNTERLAGRTVDNLLRFAVVATPVTTINNNIVEAQVVESKLERRHSFTL